MLDWFGLGSKKPILYREATGSDTAAFKSVVFVHGLGSDAAKSWAGMIGLCAADNDLIGYTLDCYTYPTTRRPMPWTRLAPLSDLALGLETELRLRHRNYSEVLLICHSMGGLVAKQYIVDCLKAGQKPLVNRMLLLATPNSGAGLATVGQQIFPGNKHIELLSPFSDAIENLSRDWAALDVHRCVAVQYAAGGADLIVSAPSARGGADRQQANMLIGYDHSTIIAGKKSSDSNYLLIKEFVLGTSGTPTPAAAPVQGPEISAEADPLFEIYQTAHEPYYIVRSNDEFLHKAATSGHVWITGPSGLGKTAALQRRALLSGWGLVHILLASTETLTADHILWSICAQIADAQGSEPPPVGASSAALVGRFRQLIRSLGGRPTAFLIEEIPLPPGAEYAKLIQLVSQLMLGIEAEQAGAVHLFFSSINCPSQDIPPGMAKLRTRLPILALVPWTDDELGQLVERLSGTCDKNLSPADRQSIVAAADGSPRFAKSLFRRWRNGTDGGLALAALLASVQAEQI